MSLADTPYYHTASAAEALSEGEVMERWSLLYGPNGSNEVHCNDLPRLVLAAYTEIEGLREPPFLPDSAHEE
ncbi:MAG: hypothetical protein WED00_04360 [Aquisalimonadaceae bacterium]